MLDYQGEKHKLFKGDFDMLFIENSDIRLFNHGFLRGYLYDKAGFDDITWLLFKKNENSQERQT